MAAMIAPRSDSRVYRTPFSCNRRVESISRNDFRHTRVVTVYNWYCGRYQHGAPTPSYRGSEPGQLRAFRSCTDLARIEAEPSTHDSATGSSTEHIGSPRTYRSLSHHSLSDHQEESLFFDALDAGVQSGPQDLLVEIEALTQDARNDAEWRTVTRDFEYPGTPKEVQYFEGFNATTHQTHDVSQISNSYARGSSDASKHSKEIHVPTKRRDNKIDSRLVVIYGEAVDRASQQGSPAISPASSTDTTESSIFDDQDNNGTLSYGIGNMSEVDKDNAWKDDEATTEGLAEPVDFMFPTPSKPSPRLLCEFIGYGKCKRTFAPQDFDAWAEHIMNGHMQGKLPALHLCWFCDDSVFQADDPSDEENKEKRYLARQKRLSSRSHMAQDYQDNTQLPPKSHMTQDYQDNAGLPPRRVMVVSALVNILRKLLWPRIEKNTLRRCGYPLYIDVPPEQKQDALEFAQAAAGSTSQIQVSKSNGNMGAPQTSNSSSNLASGTVTSGWAASSASTPSQSLMKSTRIFQPPDLPPGTKQFLLLCVNTGTYQIQLGHIDLTNVIWDVSLFGMIRETYKSMRGRFVKNPFIVPTTIEYVKFELVSRSNTGECIGNYEKDSIPGKEEIARKEYTLSPYPPRIGRVPIQPHVFMHSFLSPGDHLGGLAVQQLPKKVGRRLKCTRQARNSLDVPHGWGIYIVEGINTSLVVLCLGGLVGLLSLLVLLWSTLRGDVQGGTGIGQYGLAVIALATAILTLKPLKGNFSN
ncbi:hypothetical protein NPX13_g5204 [Xylaria arbuscula]|uniref:Uncharacterized protein n=1 Tax=Xylaria arbuscula TaxID=114810 RepID=A0A9W8TND2_9PEZI|nr:hypothetical protein NPX13_g5204 [Xylaria arbuscula]